MEVRGCAINKIVLFYLIGLVFVVFGLVLYYLSSSNLERIPDVVNRSLTVTMNLVSDTTATSRTVSKNTKVTHGKSIGYAVSSMNLYKEGRITAVSLNGLPTTLEQAYQHPVIEDSVLVITANYGQDLGSSDSSIFAELKFNRDIATPEYVRKFTIQYCLVALILYTLCFFFVGMRSVFTPITCIEVSNPQYYNLQ